MAGFGAEIDLRRASDGAPLPSGIWTFELDVGTDRVRRRVALRTGSGPGPDLPARPIVDADRGARLEVTPSRMLRLRIGQPGGATAWSSGLDDRRAALTRAALRRTVATRAGGRAAMALEELRPALAARWLVD